MEAAEILQKLGIEGVENIEQFTSKFNESFVNRKIAIEDEEIKSKIVGKFTGGLSTLLKREFEFENKDIDGKKVEEIVSLGLTKLRGKISDLEINAGKTKDEAVADLQGKLEKYKKDYTDFKSQNETLSKALEDKENGFATEKKNWIINQKFGEVQKKAHSLFSEEAVKNALTMEGFNTIVSKKYRFDLDDTNELAVYNAEGNRIANPNKIGAFLTPEEVLLKEATENKLIKMNEGKATPQAVQKPTFKVNEQNQGNVKLHPNLLKRA